MTEELINLLESVVVGLLTGIVTGVIVTKYYRKKDEAIEKSKYINSLTKYIRKLRNEMFFSGGNIPDEYIEDIYKFIDCNNRPEKYNWINFSEEEENTVKAAIQICDNIADTLVKIIRMNCNGCKHDEVVFAFINIIPVFRRG